MELLIFLCSLDIFTGSERVFHRFIPETMPVVVPTRSAARPVRPVARPTALKSRQWSADTFVAGVDAAQLESKQEPWSDGEDDPTLLTKIQVGTIMAIMAVDLLIDRF